MTGLQRNVHGRHQLDAAAGHELAPAAHDHLEFALARRGDGQICLGLHLPRLPAIADRAAIRGGEGLCVQRLPGDGAAGAAQRRGLRGLGASEGIISASVG